MQQTSAPGTTTTAAVTQAPVRLVRFRVRDFRGIEDATLDLGMTTVVIGENNVGKTALLEALDIALGSFGFALGEVHVAERGLQVLVSGEALDAERGGASHCQVAAEGVT